MKSQDWANPDEQRTEIINQLSELCMRLGLNYSYTEKKFTISMPGVMEQSVTGPHRSVKRVNPAMFDQLSDWLASTSEQSDNILPDELPPTTEPLDEGEKPEGNDEP